MVNTVTCYGVISANMPLVNFYKKGLMIANNSGKPHLFIYLFMYALKNYSSTDYSAYIKIVY